MSNVFLVIIDKKDGSQIIKHVVAENKFEAKRQAMLDVTDIDRRDASLVTTSVVNVKTHKLVAIPNEELYRMMSNNDK